MKKLNEVVWHKPTVVTTMAIAGLIPSLANAHPGHFTNALGTPMTLDFFQAFSAGLWHPLSGADHLVMAIGAGMLLYSLRQRYSGIAALLLGLTAGFAIAATGTLPQTAAPWIETGILTSVVLVTMSLLSKKLSQSASRKWQAMAVLLTGSLALFHGMAHSLEIPKTVSAPGFFIGMLTMMTLLYTVGITLTKSLQRLATRRLWLQRVLALTGLAAVVLG